MPIRKIAAVISLVLLSACYNPGNTTSGTKVDQAQLNQFQKGHTTYDQVVQQLGQPTSITSAADGSRVATYSSFSMQSNMNTWSQITGGLHTTTSQSSATLFFNPSGILTNYQLSQSSS